MLHFPDTVTDPRGRQSQSMRVLSQNNFQLEKRHSLFLWLSDCKYVDTELSKTMCPIAWRKLFAEKKKYEEMIKRDRESEKSLLTVYLSMVQVSLKAKSAPVSLLEFGYK